MKEEKRTEQETATIEEALEGYKMLQKWHKAICVVSAVLICLMIVFVVWGLLDDMFSWVLISLGVLLGICGTVLFVVIHLIYNKMGSVILEYFKVAEKLSETQLVEKARELGISAKRLKLQ